MEEGTRIPSHKRRTIGATTVLLLLAAGLLLAGVALAQDASPVSEGITANYDLSWWTVDGGGHTWSSGGGYALGGSIGQPDAGLVTDTGYALAGGFWDGGAQPGEIFRVYLPIVLRPPRGE